MNASWRVRPSLIGIAAGVFDARGKACLEQALRANAFPDDTPLWPILSFKKAGDREAGTPQAKRDVASGFAGRMTGLNILHRYLWRQHHMLSRGYAATSGPIADRATHPRAPQ